MPAPSVRSTSLHRPCCAAVLNAGLQVAHPHIRQPSCALSSTCRRPMLLLAARSCSHLHRPARHVLAAKGPLQLLQLLLVAGVQALPLASASSQVTASRGQLRLHRAEDNEIHTAAWQWFHGQEGWSHLSSSGVLSSDFTSRSRSSRLEKRVFRHYIAAALAAADDHASTS